MNDERKRGEEEDKMKEEKETSSKERRRMRRRIGESMRGRESGRERKEEVVMSGG